ncbi:MAG TPA: SGNH/GDSL hydrolase family protein, partial [Myxococcaceae bacterium]|nr:SGNH/GDSL hydrolase family protein [Myxococcaceae bacterium]
DLFPEFRGRDLSARGPARLVHRAQDGATVDALEAQRRGVEEAADAVALVTVGGNDLLRGLMVDQGPGVEVFGRKISAFLEALPIRPVFLANVYDPTLGDDGKNFTGVPAAVARKNLARVNATLRALAPRFGSLVDIHDHFLKGDASWFTSTIEPSLRGASEVRRCFWPSLQAVLEAGPARSADAPAADGAGLHGPHR